MKKLLPLLALCLLAGACGDDGPDQADAGTTTTATTAAAVPDDVPSRIVSLSPSLTEWLYAVGAGDQVVAVDSNSDYPPGVPTTDLSGFHPNLEAIAALDPDLVVVSGDRDGIVDALEGVGIETLLLPTPSDVDDVYLQITRIGEKTGHVDEAVELADQLKADLEAIADEVPDRTTPLTCFYELSDDLSTVTPDTFIGSLLRMAGMRSIAEGTGYITLSNESIIAEDPDYVFVAHAAGDSPDAATVAARPGWADLAAVRTPGHVLVLDTDIAARWGPRIVDLLRTIVDATT